MRQEVLGLMGNRLGRQRTQVGGRAAQSKDEKCEEGHSALCVQVMKSSMMAWTMWDEVPP